MIGAGWAFVYRAGTLILASMVLIWALLYFPSTMPDGRSYDIVSEEMKDEAERHDGAERNAKADEAAAVYGEWKRQSLLGRAGQALEPVFRPLGWDWKIGMSAIAGSISSILALSQMKRLFIMRSE